MTREQLIGAIAALEEIEQLRNIRTLPLDCIMYLRFKYRAQLAALPEPAQQPWTDRERRLREALEACAKLINAEWFIDDCPTNESPRMEYEAAMTALAEAPPPDPRDEALERAEKALKHCVLGIDQLRQADPPFSALSVPLNAQLLAGDALAAIARAKGGTRE